MSTSETNPTAASAENTAPPPAPDAPPPLADTAPEGAETVHKTYARDLREGERVHTVFKVARKAKVNARSGKTFLAVTLVDRTGEVDARVFEKIDVLEGLFAEGDFVLLGGAIIQFHGKLQILIDSVERLDPEPIDPAEFTPPAAPPAAALPETSSPSEASGARESGGGGKGVAAVREFVDRVQDPQVKALLLAFLDDPTIARGLPVAPAAKGIHHAYRGGLVDHILSVLRLAHRMADHYPALDRDLLVAGALLHDIGKVSELSYDKGFDYTDEGRLVGHLVMTAQMIREKASQIPGFSKELEQHLTHIVIAHHGQLEYGSPKLPVTLEAYVVHMIDSLDSRIASWMELMQKDSNDRWTDVSRLYERHLWKGPSPTVRRRSPVEGRTGPKRNRDKKKARAGVDRPGSAPEVSRKPEVRERPTREHTKPREERSVSLPKELTFKPFSLLATKDTSPPAEAKAEASSGEAAPTDPPSPS